MSPNDGKHLQRLAPVLLGAALVVVLFDAVGALASKALGFSYGSLAVGSFVIYAGAGFFGARVRGWLAACVTGAVTGFADSTLGWALSWTLGPGRPPDGFTGWGPILLTVVLVTATGAIFGCAGGLVEQLRRRRKVAA